MAGEGKAPMGLDLSLGAGPQGLGGPLTHGISPNCPSLSLVFPLGKWGSHQTCYDLLQTQRGRLGQEDVHPIPGDDLEKTA